MPRICEVMHTRIFWFEPSEELFQRLPDSIANELRKEYQVNVLKFEETKGETVNC